PMAGGRYAYARILAGALALASITCTGDGGTGTTAQGINNCAPLELDPARLVRQMSLDLRGGPASFEEMQAAVRAGAVPDSTIDAMLHSPEFLEQVKQWHGAILWPNIDQANIRVSQLVMRGGPVGPN